ncbi:MAG: hypothetical protein V3V28_11620 [Polaribacter sp.]|uniref:hypothetical protein n=1 Tax=Polaribacter sp. TaxID=1920175 RepID=UPI002F350FF3
MNRIPFNISKKAEKLITRQWFIEKLFEYLLPLTLVSIFPFMTTMKLFSNLNKKEPIGLSILLLIFTYIISGIMIYSIFNMYKLNRIKGISRGKNSSLLKKIAEKNKWNISDINQQILIINFSWQDFGTNWGKQLTILFDGNDILVNCISFGLHSMPSPFHWFASKRKLNKLKMEFESGIKNVLQHHV